MSIVLANFISNLGFAIVMCVYLTFIINSTLEDVIYIFLLHFILIVIQNVIL